MRHIRQIRLMYIQSHVFVTAIPAVLRVRNAYVFTRTYIYVSISVGVPKQNQTKIKSTG